VAQAIDPSPEWQQYAVAAAQIVGADYAGVDLLVSRAGEVFLLEVNGIPGWKGLQNATGVDVAGAIVQQVERRVADRRPTARESVLA
jgi:glutathione synthase/RimK-type ligase-like ATP-grasp enzyme